MPPWLTRTPPSTMIPRTFRSVPTGGFPPTSRATLLARILVTDGEQRSSLAVVRSLGRAGHEVFICSARGRPLAGASRFTRRVHAVADPSRQPESFRGDVLRIIEEESIGVLMPMTDTSLPLLLDLRDCPNLKVPFAPLPVYEAISDKRNLMDVAKGLGVPVPQQIVVERPSSPGPGTGGDIGPFDSETSLVLKPARSAVVRPGGIHRFGVRMLDRAGDLPSALEAFPAEAFPILVQERITGPGLGAFILAEDGRMLATFGHRRLREKPPTGGVSVYREAVPLREDVRAYAAKIIEAFRWTGVAMVEFKEDASTGTPYLMEVNGRFWGSLQLAIDAGIDFPKMLVDLALGGPVPSAPVPAYGVRSRWFWGDVDHLLWMLLRGGQARAIDPALPTALGAVLRFLAPRAGDRFEVLRLADPQPFLRESVQWFRGVLTR